jgi:hypothetical protein
VIEAFVLVQAADPGPRAAVDLVDELRDQLLDTARVWPTAGPYDAVVHVKAVLGPRDLAVRVTGIQELPDVGRTLTLPVVPPAEEVDQ